MGVSACSDCTTINNHRRTVCRTCGAQLKPYDTPPAQGTGRITFDMVTAAVLHPTTIANVEDVYTIPVLFDGEDIGVYLHLTRHGGYGDTSKQLLDACAIVTSALRSKSRRRV